MNDICRYLGCTRADLLDETISADPSVSRNMLFAPLDVCGYGNLRGLVAAVMTSSQEEIDIATKMLKSQYRE